MPDPMYKKNPAVYAKRQQLGTPARDQLARDRYRQAVRAYQENPGAGIADVGLGDPGLTPDELDDTDLIARRLYATWLARQLDENALRESQGWMFMNPDMGVSSGEVRRAGLAPMYPAYQIQE